MSERGKIYTITTLQSNLERKSRCVGFCFNVEDAKKEVENNTMDIYEAGYYPYCVIEEVQEGIYFFPRHEIWYKWNQDTNVYTQLLEKPKRFARTCCFGIG